MQNQASERTNMTPSIVSILKTDITSVDVMCGKDKESFNHAGNRRLRFAVALNLNRYRYAINRKTKRNVVESILQPIEMAGGRFLEKVSSNEDHWRLVSSKVSRLKVSHALRDKLPSNIVERAKNKLNALFKHHTTKNENSDESVYNAINAMIFHICLDHYDHTCNNGVENILSKVISDFLKGVIDGRKELKDGANEVENFEKDDQCSLVNRVMILASLAAESKMKIHLDLEPRNESTPVEHSSTKGFLPDQMSGIQLDDLPQSFTAEDCEQLVASLDN